MLSWLKQKVSLATSLSDVFLIREVKNGRTEAFGKLYLKYLDAIFRYLYFRLNQNEELAEDLCETVFLKALKHLPDFDENKGTFKAWLYAVARNSVNDYYRQKPTVSLSQNPDLIADGPNREENLLQEKEDQNDLKEALNLLTDEQKQVLTLKYIEEMPYEEIAKILNKREDAVRAVSHRALKRLKKILKKYD